MRVVPILPMQVCCFNLSPGVLRARLYQESLLHARTCVGTREGYGVVLEHYFEKEEEAQELANLLHAETAGARPKRARRVLTPSEIVSEQTIKWLRRRIVDCNVELSERIAWLEELEYQAWNQKHGIEEG